MKTFAGYLTWIMIVESLGAAAAFAIAHDYKHAAYWFFAACLTFTVTLFN